MYRKLLLLFLCGRTLTAPQQGIETIAEVKPTIFDYPAEVYDLPAHYPTADTFINGRQDYSAIYGMTTENIGIDSTDYNEELTDGYDKMTETIPRDYGSRENIAEIYSKIGYFTNNYLPGQRTVVKDEGNQIKNVDATISGIRNVSDIRTTNSTEHISNDAEKTTIISEVNSTTIDDKNAVDKINIGGVLEDFKENKNTLDINRNLGKTLNMKDIANVVEDTPNYDKSYFSSGHKGYMNENLIQKGRRRFRSNCRCEKIWNCPKLQITVPRCPDEYFMCCF